jgi:phosphonatase-like hydrolase
VSEVPGAARLVQRLRAAGVRVVLNTGFDRALTSHLLGVLGWQALADAVICGDDVPEGRPAPYLIFRAMEATATTRLREVANVGDTTLDLQAADNAGTGWNIGVWSGAHDRATLAAAPHSHLCCSVADVGIVLEVL